jgi:hypothetical protein
MVERMRYKAMKELLAVSRRSLKAAAIATLVAIASCNSSTGPPDPSGASYSRAFDPPRIVMATENCDRLLTYGILSLGEGDFDLSVNLIDDCSRGGGGHDFWEVLILGQYTVRDTLLSFNPEVGKTPPFSGTFDAEYVRLELPPRPDSLSILPISLELGPRAPF